MPTRPILRQAGELTAQDFAAHPVWVHCHVVDYDEPWFDDTDEETFRPWDGVLPIDPSHAIFLIAARVALADGRTYAGFLTPADMPDDVATLQPHVFVDDECFGFWGGMPGVPKATRLKFYRAVGEAARVFPITVVASNNLANGVVSGKILGFCRYEPGEVIVCEE